jgi:hypothetical protein
LTPAAKKTEVGEEEVISLDMTKAKTLEALPAPGPYLLYVGDWAYGKSAKGAKVTISWVVAEPSEFANRRIREDISLDNEYTLGAFKQRLLALGFAEDKINSKKFSPPTKDEVMGMQLTARVRIQTSEEYGDQNRITRVAKANVYKAI